MFTSPSKHQHLDVDVAVIGGGPAGLTGAVTLARARRSVAVIDSGTPRNARSSGIHMFLTRDGMTPTAFAETGRAELVSYGGRVVNGEVTDVRRVAGGFEITVDGASAITAGRLLVTTGLTDELPAIAGIEALWGQDVHHCPYCHGYELQGRTIGVLGSGPLGLHKALMFRQLVADVTLFVHDAPPPTEDEAEQLAARGIRVVTGHVDHLVVVDGHLAGIRLQNGSTIELQSLIVGPRMVARSALLPALGLTTTQHPMGLGEFVPADPSGFTGSPGIWAAGNITDLSAGVVVAAAAGMTAAAAINADLIAADTDRAVAAYRRSHTEPVGVSA